MNAILITGMSGTGKSTLLEELSRRGYQTVDTDYNGWCILSRDGTEMIWDEAKMSVLLSEPDDRLIISGCVSNQSKFYNRFSSVVLLTAPIEVILARIVSRTNNQFGKTHDEMQGIVKDIADVEPRLRTSVDVELDSRLPVAELADAIEQLVKDKSN